MRAVIPQGKEKRFQEICKLSCMIFNLKIALVALVDEDTVWYKGATGFPGDPIQRNHTFCSW